MLSCIAVDDEPLALRLIEEHCQKISFISLKKTFLSGIDAISYLKEAPIDVVILDINMPEIDGIALSTLLPASIQIIFITAYENFALKSYDVNTTDYILKPASFNRVYKALSKCMHRKELLNLKKDDESITEPHIFLKDNKTIHQILISQILYIEGLKDYAKIFLTNKEKIVIRESLKNILEALKMHGFIRVHRSYIIPLAQINSIEGLSIKIRENRIPINKISKEYILNEYKKRGILGTR